MVQDIYQIIKRINDDQKNVHPSCRTERAAALGIADHGYVMENGRIVLGGMP